MPSRRSHPSKRWRLNTSPRFDPSAPRVPISWEARPTAHWWPSKWHARWARLATTCPFWRSSIPPHPHLWDPDEVPTEEAVEIDDAHHAYGMAVAVARMTGKEDQLRLTFEELQGLPPERMMEKVLDRTRELGLAEFDTEVGDLLRYREAYNSRLLAGRRYRARPYAGSVLLFKALGSPGPDNEAEANTDESPGDVEDAVAEEAIKAEEVIEAEAETERNPGRGLERNRRRGM